MNTDLMFSSATPEHFTPPWILDLVEKVGPIGLDPCSHPKSEAIKRAHRVYMSSFDPKWGPIVLGPDGLVESWNEFPQGLVFVNPPYGRELAKWAAKMAKEKQCAIIALVPARVDTGWWRELNPIAWCALAGRLKFWHLEYAWEHIGGEFFRCEGCGYIEVRDGKTLNPPHACGSEHAVEAENSAPFPSAVCLLHAQHLKDRFVEVFSPHGPVYGRL